VDDPNDTVFDGPSIIADWGTLVGVLLGAALGIALGIALGEVLGAVLGVALNVAAKRVALGLSGVFLGFRITTEVVASLVTIV
jgi:hypothetical protein